ncbi:MAG: hypothetical protein GY754_01430 [bacterium]|nr:hypothetical protein [bacterium]
MKRNIKLIPVLLLMVLVFSITGSTNEKRTPESIIPQSATLFIKSANIERVLKSLNYAIRNLMDAQKKQELLQERDSFKTLTGIDFLNAKSLQAAGIDTKRSVGFAYFKKDGAKERMMFAVPVLDAANFPLKFVDIIKKGNKKPGRDLNPVITPHKSGKVYQVESDMFFTGTGGHLVLSSSGELIKEVIDITTENKNAFSADSMYRDYLGKAKHDYDINFFAKQEFIVEALMSGMQKMNRRKRPPRRRRGPNENYRGMNEPVNESFTNSSSYQPVQYSPQPRKQASPFDIVDYASAGIAVKSNRLLLNLAAKFNAKDPTVDMILSIVKSGGAGKALSPANPSAYSYTAVDLKYLENLCKKGPSPVCMYYNQFKMQLNTELGINASKDFIPYYTGIVNIVIGQTISPSGIPNLVVYLPMTSAKKTKILWTKARRGLQKKYKKTSGFGDKKIGRNRAFWFADEKGLKIYILYNNKGIYLGSDAKLLKSALSYKKIKSGKGKKLLVSKMVKNLFFLAYIKRNSFIGNLLAAKAAQTPGGGGLTNSIGDIYLMAGKNGKLLSIDVDIEVTGK